MGHFRSTQSHRVTFARTGYIRQVLIAENARTFLQAQDLLKLMTRRLGFVYLSGRAFTYRAQAPGSIPTEHHKKKVKYTEEDLVWVFSSALQLLCDLLPLT